MNAHVERLSERHGMADEALQQELKRPAPDSVAVRVLKKLKLRLKDEIEAILARTERREPQLPAGHSSQRLSQLRPASSRNNSSHQTEPSFPYRRRC